MENIIDKIEKAVNGEITPSEVYAELLGEQASKRVKLN